MRNSNKAKAKRQKPEPRKSFLESLRQNQGKTRTSLTIDLDLHPTQQKVFLDKTRFKVVFCGRRWGKTAGAVRWVPLRLLVKPNRLGWWVAPTYRQAKIAYRYFRRKYGKNGIIISENRSDLTMELINECRLEFRSSDVPDNLRGEGVDVLVLDEFASMPEAIWTEILRPTLMDSKGEAVFIGTPKGMNWAQALWIKGKGEDKDWKSWQYSTYDNPFIDKAEVRKAEEDMPEIVARQEIHAEPMEGEGVVFRNVDDLSKLQTQEPEKDEVYMVGVDLAKYRDFTVISVFLGRKQVYMERFNKIDWAIQRSRIAYISEWFNNAEVIIDSTGVGDPIFEELKRAGLHITPYGLNSRTKRELIDNLIVLMDKKEVQLLNNEVQKSELKSYQYEITGHGNLRMNAPAGKHDDTVIACALGLIKAPNVPRSVLISNRPKRPSRF